MINSLLPNFYGQQPIVKVDYNFLSLLIDRDVFHFIQELLGHGSLKITENYIPASIQENGKIKLFSDALHQRFCLSHF